MKKVLITIALFSIAQISVSQNLEGRATYLSKLKVEMDNALEGQDIPEGLKGMIAGLLKKQSEKEFVLEFTNTESTFKQVEVVDNSINTNGMSIQSMVIEMPNENGGENLYKNLTNNTYIEEAEMMGKSFLVEDKLPEVKWNLTNEKKTIGKYKCNKAFYIKEYETIENPLESDKSITVQDTITAWYSTQIPVSNGPKFISGLPGLVLEYTNSVEIFQCSEVVLNPSKKVVITKPTKGKKIGAAAYKKLQARKSKEQLQEIENMGGGENNFEIIIKQ